MFCDSKGCSRPDLVMTIAKQQLQGKGKPYSESNNGLGKVLVYEDALLACHRVGSNNRVDRRQILILVKRRLGASTKLGQLGTCLIMRQCNTSLTPRSPSYKAPPLRFTSVMKFSPECTASSVSR